VKIKQKSAFALQDTLAVYGIHKNPFPIDETDGLFFSTPRLDKQIDALRNLVEYGDLLLVISGVEGAGKTSFLNQLLLAADERWKCCRVDAGAAMTIDSLVDELLAGFGLKTRGDDAQDDEALLRAHLADLHANGDIALVAVDDAHLLPQICTEFLLALAQERGHIEVRLVLATEPGRLGFPTSDGKRVHVVVLRPFDLQQSGDYLHARLSYAGLVGDSPFGASVVDDIHQDSGGRPGAIHPLALHTLLANPDTSQSGSGIRPPGMEGVQGIVRNNPCLPRSTSSIPGLVGRRAPKTTRLILYVAAALVIGGAAAVFLRPESGVAPMVANDSGTTGKVRGRITGMSVETEAAQLEVTDGDGRAARSAEPEPEPFAQSVTAKAPAKDSGVAAPSIVTLNTGSDAKVFVLDDSGTSTRAAVAVTSPAPVKGKESARGIEPVVRLASNVRPAAGAPAKAKVKSRAAHDLDWLRKQDPSHYVIQLVGARDAAAVGKFLDDHKLGSKGAWFVTSREDKPWYVVVYGMYPDSASARAAVKTLPAALRAGSPWPRSVASVVESAR
jgi:DamX protein